MDPQQSQSSQTPQKPNKGYGKRPLWQWIVLYVIIGAIVYGLIYYFFFYHSGSNTAPVYPY